MALTNEISPAQLTGFAREIQAAYDTDITAELLPNVQVDDDVFTFKVNSRAEQVAKYRSFDAETAIGGGQAAEEKTARLLPVGLKDRLGERDKLRRRGGGAESFQAAADALAEQMVEATVNRVRLARAEALVHGSLTLAENRVRQTIDFDRHPDHTATAALHWNDAEADPISEYEAWVDAYETRNGQRPTRAVGSTRIAAALRRSAGVRAHIGASDQGVVSLEAVNAALDELDLPRLTVNNAVIAGQRVFPSNVLLLAAPGVGVTPWGTTAEADDPRYQLAGEDLPGLVVGVYEEDDPLTMWVRANSISFPVLTESNLSFAATVLPAE